jgi:hypothetical protein
MRTTPGFLILSVSLLFACAKETPDDTGDAAVETDTDGGDGDGDAPGDGDPGDGDTGDGDGDPGSETFVPEDGDIPSINTCDPFAQDCPEGEKCVAYASSGGTWDANRCVPVTGSGSTGDPCVYQGAASGADDCDQTNVCWNALDVDGVLVGTCYPFCTGGADNPLCDEADTSCRVVNDGAIAVCLPNCDPLLQECTEGLGCYWSGGSQTFQCIITAGGIPTGEACGFNNDCNPGHFCADAAALETCDGSACCAVFCDLTEDPSTCVAPLECVSFFEEGQAPPTYEDLGLCILPA